MIALLIGTMNTSAQLALTGVAIKGQPSFVDASSYPEITVRFRATLAATPVDLAKNDLYVSEGNSISRITSIANEGNGLHTIKIFTSRFASGGTFLLYAASSGEVGEMLVQWNAGNITRGGEIFICDSSFKRVPLYLDLGDVEQGTEKLQKLNLRTFTSTRDAKGNERWLTIDTIRTSTSNFRVVWKGTYGKKPPPVTVDVGTDYRFDLICQPSTNVPISDVLTVVYEGGLRREIMLFANTPTYKPTTILQVLSPNGGEQLAACQDITISWKGAIKGFSSHVEYSTNNGRSWKYIDSTLDSSITWQVPVEYTDSAKIRVYQKQGASGATWLYGDTTAATNLGFSANGRYLAVAHKNGKIIEWDVVTSKIVNTYQAEGVLQDLTKISKIGYMGQSRSLIAVIDRDSPIKDQIQRFDLGTSGPVAKADVNLGNVNEFIADSGAKTVYVSGTMGARVRVYDAATLTERSSVALESPVTAARSADGLLVLTLVNGDVLRFDPDQGKVVYRFATDLPSVSGPVIRDLSVSRTNRLIALAGQAASGSGNSPQEQRTLVYDTQSNSLIRVIYREGSDVVGVTINPSETYITMGFAGQPQIRQYDVVNRKILGPIPGMPGHSQLMTDVEYGADGSTLASCSEDNRTNVLLRRIITPELDESNSTFRIVPLDFVTPTLSFGVHYIGATIDTLIAGSICNKGVVPAIIDRGELQTGSWLSLRSNIWRDTISPGECLRVEFRAVPKDTGNLVDTLDLYACDRTFRVPIVIRSIDRNLATFGDMTGFGDVCVRDTAQKTFVVVRNDDPVPVVIDGISMYKGLFSQFHVLGYTPGDTLQPGESMSIRVLFVPTQRGHDTDRIVIRYAGQNSIVRYVRVYGRGAGADLDVSHRQLAFIPEVPERAVVLKNGTQNPITLNAAQITTGAPFTLLTPLPLTIPPMDSVTIRVRYDGGTIGGNDRLDFDVVPCAATTSIALVPYSATTTVWMQSVTVDPRSTARLPIVVSIVEPVPYKGPLAYEGVMNVYQRHFYADSISVIGGSGQIISQDVQGDVRSIRFAMNTTYTRENVVAYLVGSAGIADVDSSIVTFDTTAPAFGTAVRTSYKSSLLRIANPNPDRHILTPRGPVIRMLSPLPASDDVHVTVDANETAASTIRIVDMQGIEVATFHAVIASGQTSITVDVRSLPRGMYRLVVQTEQSSSSSPLMVLRP